VASNFYSSWHECPSNFWALPTFSELSSTSHKDLTSPVAAAATAQVKLCHYDEEEPQIWFRLIEAQFAAAGIKSQKLKYANALASLPKQVLRDILHTLDVCDDSAELCDFLKHILLGQFGKANGSPTLNYFAFPWKCRTLNPVISWESSNSISLQEFCLTMIFFFQCF
jgi:hypothetical protein